MLPKKWLLLLDACILWTMILYYVWIPRKYFYTFGRFLDYEIVWKRKAAAYRRLMLRTYGTIPIEKLKITLPNKQVIYADKWNPKKDSWLRDDRKLHKKWPAPKHPQLKENAFASSFRWNGEKPYEFTKRNLQKLSKATNKLVLVILGITLLHYLYDQHGEIIFKFLFNLKARFDLWLYSKKKKLSFLKDIY